MLSGETDGLRAGRVTALEPGLAKKLYRFQICNDDGREHFCQVSRQFPALCFVLVYWNPNGPPSGSYFIRGGRVKVMLFLQLHGHWTSIQQIVFAHTRALALLPVASNDTQPEENT
jgi:hypothetical protein